MKLLVYDILHDTILVGEGESVKIHNIYPNQILTTSNKVGSF